MIHSSNMKFDKIVFEHLPPLIANDCAFRNFGKIKIFTNSKIIKWCHDGRSPIFEGWGYLFLF